MYIHRRYDGAMRMSEKQRKAVEFVAANPEASIDQIVAAAGVSTTGSNAADFIFRLLANGFLRLDVSPEVRDSLENEAL